MRRDSGRRKELQNAEYRNRKDGMETGWTEEERSTGGTAARGEREEGKRKRRRLSSQKQAEADERKRKQGKTPKESRKTEKVSTCGTAVGAKQGRTKGNEQKAEYRNREGRHERSGQRERGEPRKRERTRSTEEATVRRRQEEKGKEETETE